MSRFLPSNASSPAKTQRSAVTARSVSDGRSCGRASPTSLSWQSSIENDRETSTSVPFLHLWLPPRVGVHSPPLTTQAPSNNTNTTAAVTITPTSTPPTMDLTPTRVVVKDEEPGASVSSCMDGTCCDDGALAGEVHVDASSAAAAPTNVDSKVTVPASSEGTEERSQSSCRSGTTHAVRGEGGAVRGADAARGGASPDASPSLPRPVVVLRRRCGPPAVYATMRTAAAKASDHSEGRGDNNKDDDVSSSPSRSLPSALEVSRTLPSTYFHADASPTTTKAKTPVVTPTTTATTAEGVRAVSAAESQGSAQGQPSDCQSGSVALAKKKKAAAAPAGAAPTSIHRAPSLTELTSPQTHAAASQSRLLTHKSPPPPTSSTSATTTTSAASRLLSPTTDGVATTMTMAIPMVSAVGSESPASVLTASPAAPLAVLSNALTASCTPPFPPSPLTTTAAVSCGFSSYPPPPSISLGESKASARHGSAVNFFSCSDSPLSVPFLSAPNAWKTALDGGERHEDNVSVSPPPSARLLQPVAVAVAAAHAARTLHDEEEGERVDDHKEAGEEGQEATTAKLASNVKEEPTLADKESASVPEKAAAPTQLTQPPLFASQAGRRLPSSAAADAHTTVVPATPLAKKQVESGGLCQTFAAMADIGVRLRSSSRSFSPSSPSSSSFPSSRISCGSPLASRDVCGGEGGDDASDTEHNTMVWPASTTAVAVVDSVEHTEPHVNHRDHAGNYNNNSNNNNKSSRSRQQQQSSRRSVCSSMDVDAVSSASPSPSPVARSPAAPSTMRRNNGSQVNTDGVLRGKHPTAAPRSVSHHTSTGSGSKAAHRAKDQRSNMRGTRHPQQQQQQHHHHPSQHPSSLNVTANRTTTATSRGQSPAPGAAAAGVSPAAAVAPAHSKSNLMARLYAPPMTTPLTSMRYVPRTRDEEIELAELQQRLSAFVFPPAPHHQHHQQQQSHHRRVASPAPSSASAASHSRSASPACYAVSEKSSPPPPPPSKTTAAGATAKTTKKDEKTSPSVEPRDAFSRRRSSLSLTRTGPRVTRKAAPIASSPLHTRGEQKRETTQLLH